MMEPYTRRMADMTLEEMYENVVRLMKDPATVESGRRLDESVDFARVHDEMFRREHPNRWIAVHRDRLVAVREAHSDLIQAIKDQNVPINEVYTEFLREPRPVIILS
jgi:hypothetical protein